jgi:O-succinylbenzoic acid--CoA ligase
MLPDWLHQRASLTPDRLALVVGDLRWSFRELDQQTTQIAQRLTTLDVSAGDRVALLARNGAPFVTLVHALSRLGLVLVPLNTRLSPAELRWQLADVRARLLIYDEANAQSALAAAHDFPQLRSLHLDRWTHTLRLAKRTSDSRSGLPTSDFPPPTSHLDSLHTILYTSGTTGQPKGAMLTYGNHWWNAMGSALNLGLHADDRWLACLPLFHVGGLAILLRGVIYGNAVIVHQAFDPAAVNRAIDEEGVTLISVVSTMLQQMLAERGERSYPPTLRCALLGGGPAPRDLLEECARRGVPVAQTYGLTEAASQVATLAPEDALRKLGSAGKPLFPTALHIERDGVEASAGEVGEIVVRGPTVTPGYADRPEATAQAVQDGWLRTGDLGYLDDEGYLYVLDRRDDLIISGGENVYPAEVEAVLRSHPGVEEAGVVAVPDARWGQVPAAFVVARAGVEVTEAELKSFCYARLARYKVPAQIRLVPSLPRNASGKVLRRALAGK